MIEVHSLMAMIGSHTDEVMLLTYHVDQLELLEERANWVKALAYLRPRFDGDT
jgi:hypothetical protein